MTVAEYSLASERLNHDKTSTDKTISQVMEKAGGNVESKLTVTEKIVRGECYDLIRKKFHYIHFDAFGYGTWKIFWEKNFPHF